MAVQRIADELTHALTTRTPIAVPFSARGGDFSLAAAYGVQRELARRRVDAGHRIVGRKIGFANRAVWRALKLDTLAWAPMYDDTVRQVPAGAATEVDVSRLWAPKIEPEIVFLLRGPIASDTSDPAAALAAVDAMALGFEIVDSPFADAKTLPADFVAADGFHVALVMGPPRHLAPADIPALVDALAGFRLTLTCNGETAAEGGGRNVLKSPALCLGELARAVPLQIDEPPLGAGDVISTGSLTDPQRIAAGGSWTAAVAGLDLPDLTVQTV